MTANTLAEDLQLRFARGESPDWSAHDVKLWAVALDGLIHAGCFAAAGWAANELMELRPDVGLLSRLSLLLRSAPPPSGDRAFDEFRDDPAADVQVVRRQGASKVLFVFGGVAGGVGMPLPLAHRWFGQLGLHVIYLRDHKHQGFNEGIVGLGQSYEATLDQLRQLADQLYAQTLLTFGNSVGGYGALRYGLDLRARAMLGFSAATSLVPPLATASRLSQQRISMALDLRPFFLAASPPPKTLLVFCGDHEVDARQARNLDGIEGVVLAALPGMSRHEAVMRAAELGRFGQYLDWLNNS